MHDSSILPIGQGVSVVFLLESLYNNCIAVIIPKYFIGTGENKRMKAAFYTLGCKVNQYETQAMLEQLKESGFDIVPATEEADVYVVNSCTVTAQSDQKTRQAVRRLKRSRPEACVVLTGCMPQSYPDASLELPEADVILGNASNALLLSSVQQYLAFGLPVVEMRQHHPKEAFASSEINSFDGRTRAFVKIQDGCNRFCSYCIIPLARGRVRSRPLPEIREEVARLAQAGFREVVLVGINLSSYGRDSGDSFCDGVAAACEAEQISRVRLGSLEPDHLTDKVIADLSRQSKLCPQFHISLQSGCDETLHRMKRPYTTEEYRLLCDKLRLHFPDCALTTDVMVGFPQESEEEFQQSLDFVRSIGFSKIHIFPYSRREGTPAASLPGQIGNAEKSARVKRMAEVGDECRRQFLLSQVGKVLPVLFEGQLEENVWEGFTANYTPVRVPSLQDICHTLCQVRLTRPGEDFLWGELIPR